VSGALAPVCILAGGLGTRLGSRVRDTPKPLVEVAGRPFIEHQLALLRRHGARRVVICVGYLGERIEERVGDGRRLGLEIVHRHDPPGLAGTAGAVRAVLGDLGDRFHVLYGDTYLRIDYAAVEAAARASGRPALMTVLENAGRWDRSNVLFRDGQVVVYDKHHLTPEMRWIDYGLSVLTADALERGGPHADLADVMRELARQGLLAGYEATERFYEIGTPESLAEAEAFLAAESETTPRESSGESRA
jgi:NDP-sugar pyrophosphorylase family protein